MYDPSKIIAEKSIVDVISQYVKLTRNGHEYQGLCPFHSEKTSSFSVVPNKGFYHCFGCGAHGDVIDFIKNYFNTDFNDACSILGAEKLPPNSTFQKSPPKEIVDIYKDLDIQRECKTVLQVGVRSDKIYNPKRDIYSNYTPSLVHKYIRKDGTLSGYVIRLDIDDKKKIIMPVQDVIKDGKLIPAIIPFNKPRLIYGLPNIKEEGNIFIVEGEKTVDVFMRMSGNTAQVISWIGGTKGIKHANWKDLPPNRKYILIPDADDVGKIAMEEVASFIPSPQSIKIVDTLSKPKGWDLADAEVEGWKLNDIILFCKNNMNEISKPEPEPIPEYEQEIGPDDIPEPPPYEPDYEENLKKDYDPPKAEEDIDEEDAPDDIFDAHFRCLGFGGKNQYFYHKATGQVYSFKGSEICSKTTLMLIAPLSWWKKTFPKSTKGRSWDYIGDLLIRKNEAVGFYNKELIRCRGAFIDEGRAVLHLGNKIMCNGKSYTPDMFESKYIYKRALSLGLDTGKPLPKEESRKLVQVCRMVRWEQEYFGNILAGWMFSSLVCGVMPFRSHLYISGSSGSGKSWVMDNIVTGAMGNMPLYCSSKTTEPGIRKNLMGDVRPIIFNEAEAENASDVLRMQAIFDTARSATDEKSKAILKGSGEEGESYTIRSSFMFASINKAINKKADNNRTNVIQLAVPPKDATAAEKLEDNRDFKELESSVYNLLTEEYVASLLTRAVQKIPEMRHNHSVFTQAGAKLYGDPRKGGVYAMVLTGLYSLEYDGFVEEEQAIEYINEMNLSVETDSVESQSQEHHALDKLLFHEFKFMDLTGKNRTINLNKALFIIHQGLFDVGNIAPESLITTLEDNGIKYSNDRVYFSTKNECMANTAFKRTLWASGWVEALKRLEGTEVVSQQRFTPFLKSSAVSIPISHLIIKDNE